MCLTSHCCRRGGKLQREGRQFLGGQSRAAPSPAGWAGLCQLASAPRMSPLGANTAEKLCSVGLVTHHPGQGGLDHGTHGCNPPVPLPSNPALITRAKHPSGIPGSMVETPPGTGWPLPGQQSKWPMDSFLHEIFLWKPRFREPQKQFFEGSMEFVSSLKLVTLDFDIIQQIVIFSGFLPVRKHLDIDFISLVMEMT